jgi:hypothetical protein
MRIVFLGYGVEGSGIVKNRIMYPIFLIVFSKIIFSIKFNFWYLI